MNAFAFSGRGCIVGTLRCTSERRFEEGRDARDLVRMVSGSGVTSGIASFEAVNWLILALQRADASPHATCRAGAHEFAIALDAALRPRRADGLPVSLTRDLQEARVLELD
jgi:hypothetical protein